MASKERDDTMVGLFFVMLAVGALSGGVNLIADTAQKVNEVGMPPWPVMLICALGLPSWAIITGGLGLMAHEFLRDKTA